jgi:hypothetical protein
MRKTARPGLALRVILQARSFIVTESRAGAAPPAASARLGKASTQSAAATVAAGEIRSISVLLFGMVRPLGDPRSPRPGDSPHLFWVVLGADQ